MQTTATPNKMENNPRSINTFNLWHAVAPGGLRILASLQRIAGGQAKHHLCLLRVLQTPLSSVLGRGVTQAVITDQNGNQRIPRLRSHDRYPKDYPKKPALLPGPQLDICNVFRKLESYDKY